MRRAWLFPFVAVLAYGHAACSDDSSGTNDNGNANGNDASTPACACGDSTTGEVMRGCK